MTEQSRTHERARSGFHAAFGFAPQLEASAPGRINLLGEHTDYNQGFVLPTALPLFTSVALTRRQDGIVRVWSEALGASAEDQTNADRRLWVLRSIPAAVRDPKVLKIAIANLTTAPYGKAAREALTKLDLWKEVEPKVVIGDNITQTSQFVETGNADIGFVAMSLVLSPKLKDTGRWVEVDASLYSPLEQAAVITKKGEANPAAARYLKFLSSPQARAVFEGRRRGVAGQGDGAAQVEHLLAVDHARRVRGYAIAG